MQQRTIAYSAAALLAFAFCYGANLYFSLNGNVNDPIVSPWVPLTKDVLLIVAAAAAVFVSRADIPGALRSPSLWGLGAFAALSSIVAAASMGFNLEIASLSKNLVLYLFGGFAVASLISGQIGLTCCVRVVLVALAVSFVVSLLLLLHPVQSYDGRLYGTYGNPTSLGFAAVVAAGLLLWTGREWFVVVGAAIAAVFSSMTGSASVMLAALVLFAGFGLLEAMSKRSLRAAALGVGAYLAVFVLFGLVSGWLGIPAFGFERMMQFLGAPGDILASDSISIRAQDFAHGRATASTYHRYDSFLLSVWRNLGLIPLLAYGAFVVVILLGYAMSVRSPKDNSFAVLFLALFVLNPLLQHQLEIFPTNLLFGAVAALTMVQFTGRQQAA